MRERRRGAGAGSPASRAGSNSFPCGRAWPRTASGARHPVFSRRLALGDAIALSADDRATTYWVNLLAWIGCTADSFELTKLFGDDIALRAASYDVDLAGVSQVGFLLRHAAAGKSVIKRVSTAATLLASSGTKVEQALVAHCEVTGHLATRLGLGGQVAEALGYAFARWDGKGLPAGVGKPTFRCLLGFSIWPMSSSPTSAWAGWIGL